MALALVTVMAMALVLEMASVPGDVAEVPVVEVMALPSPQIHRCVRKPAAGKGRRQDSLGMAEGVSLLVISSQARCYVVQTAYSRLGLVVSKSHYLISSYQVEV